MFIIFGSPRSGTTLLAQTLNAHPKIVVPHETDFIIPSAFLFDRISDIPTRKRLLSDLIVNSSRFQATLGEYLSVDDVQDIVAQCGNRMSDLLVGVYTAVANNGGGSIAGDKSPNDLSFLRMLVKVGGLTPEIKIVHIVRDIRDVMSSLLPLNWTPNNELYFPRFWSNSNLYLHSLYCDKPEYLLVKYEEFVRSPEMTLKQVCAHINMEFQPEQLSPERRHLRYRGYAAHAKLFQPITAASVGDYRDKLDPELVTSIERQASEAMATFNYGFVSPFGKAYQEIQK